MVLPNPGKSYEQFLGEDALCKDWAYRQIGVDPGEVSGRSTASGAVIGTAVGAGAGAALGAISGDPGTGAAIGGGTGLLFGAASGAGTGETRAAEAQQKYDISYMQCMYSKGNQIPGVIPPKGRRSAPPPPPPPGY
jgi:hypothetical protein